MVELDFLIDELLVLRYLQAVEFEVEVKRRDLFAFWLVLDLVQLFKERMGKRLLDCNAVHWVECQHAFDQVDCHRVNVFQQLVKVESLFLWQLYHELLIVFILDARNECVTRGAH